MKPKKPLLLYQEYLSIKDSRKHLYFIINDVLMVRDAPLWKACPDYFMWNEGKMPRSKK